METKPFSEQGKAVRPALNLSDEELVYVLGVSFTTVNRRENGKADASKMALTLFNAFL